MKKMILILMLPMVCNIAFGQNPKEAEKLVGEGVSYHDKGDYKGALAKYDKALLVDKNNLFALSEKAMTLLTIGKYNESIEVCQIAFDLHQGESSLKYVYVTCGNAYDGIKKSSRSLEIYDEGIKKFPDFFLLHFNKGIALSGLNELDDALSCFYKAVLINPNHAGSHNAIARISYMNNQKIPSLLAYFRFLVIEPESKRANENLLNMQKLMSSNVEKTGKNSTTIYLNASMLGDSTKKTKENNFSSTELMLALTSALDFEKKNKKKSEVQQFIGKFDMICSNLKESKKDNTGFFWEYYVPYFTEMKENNLTETFAYIAFASSGDSKVSKWLKSHKDEVDKFYKWSNAFDWKSND